MSSKHLYWGFQSTQTVKPTEEELKIFQEKYKKDFEQREVYEGAELEDKFRLNSWRNPIFNEIFSIILAFEHQDTLRIQYITGTEKELLQNFVNLISEKFQDYTLVHFDAEIVLPYIGVRLNSNGHLNVPHKDLKYHNLKPWNFTGLDIKQYYKGGGKYTFSLEQIAKILSIDKEGIIPYEDEFTYFNSNGFETLKSSAIKKVEVLSQIHRKLFGLSTLTTVIVEEKVDNVEEYKQSVLETLRKNGIFNDTIKQQLKETLVNMLEEEKQHVIDIVVAHYQAKGDKVAVKKQKLKEVEDFINSL